MMAYFSTEHAHVCRSAAYSQQKGHLESACIYCFTYRVMLHPAKLAKGSFACILRLYTYTNLNHTDPPSLGKR